MRNMICVLASILLLMSMSMAADAQEHDLSPQTEECSHSVSAWQSSGETSHSGTCSLCGDAQTENHTWGEPVNSATCTADGQKTYTCTKCGATKTETASASGHSFGSWSSVDETTHKRSCTICSSEENASHSQSSETVTQKASCTSEGKRDLVCVCGHILKKDETIPKLDHSYGAWATEEGKHSRTCSGCGNVDSGSHKFDEATVVKAATCKEEGQMTKKCSVCAFTSQPEKIDKLTTHTYENACDDTCNVCDYKREAGHKYSKTWSSNGVGHWRSCTVCDGKTDEGKHIPGPAATEKKEQICLTCDYVMTPKKNHVHAFDNKWSTDKTGHWYACAGCDDQKSFAMHSYDNACDETCNICGYKNENAHDFSGSWHTTEKNHQQVCRLCGLKRPAEGHTPGPEASEKEAQTCIVCGYILAPLVEHDHVFGTRWLNNGQSHWQECECGQQTIPEVHEWNEGDKEKGGRIRFTCRTCGLERTEILESSGFPWWILITIVGLLLAGCVALYVYYFVLPKQEGKYSRKD